MVRMSYPLSRRCVAKEWRRVWQVAGLAGIHLAALLPFRIVNRYASLAALDKDHEIGNTQHQQDENERKCRWHFTRVH